MGSSPSLHRFKIKRNPDCVYEERDVDARHYVLDCPRVVAMAAALQEFDIDPEQQLYTPKIVDIAAAVMEMHGYI
ncbi:hypothetical protein LAZ67_20001253 [Cordylochernes scorpioides]|uniref:Uncharacterized protein n=1 Tax=Cordylochernes scorpioides TaxID=51811 RepID=A0ABY6LJR1_9ARAC|nr:hypothetical protein LAZ67_20001253 [Cordylochernes scorpioides]